MIRSRGRAGGKQHVSAGKSHADSFSAPRHVLQELCVVVQYIWLTSDGSQGVGLVIGDSGQGKRKGEVGPPLGFVETTS